MNVTDRVTDDDRFTGSLLFPDHLSRYDSSIIKGMGEFSLRCIQCFTSVVTFHLFSCIVFCGGSFYKDLHLRV